MGEKKNYFKGEKGTSVTQFPPSPLFNTLLILLRPCLLSPCFLHRVEEGPQRLETQELQGLTAHFPSNTGSFSSLWV